MEIVTSLNHEMAAALPVYSVHDNCLVHLVQNAIPHKVIKTDFDSEDMLSKP